MCAHSAETIPGWLLVAVAMSATTSTSASSSTVVGRALLLRVSIGVAWGLVDVAWGLLANGALGSFVNLEMQHGGKEC